jgi:hypothetical protein
MRRYFEGTIVVSNSTPPEANTAFPHLFPRSMKCSYRRYSLSDDRAQCIDGTSATYYHRKGIGIGKLKWHIHFEGGGWCYDAESCDYRSTTALGSSKNYQECLSSHELNSGYFSSNEAENPLLHNYNVIYVRYCDGGSFAGNAEQLYQVSLFTVAS